MLILAFDLAWSGPTGWVLWDSDLSDPILKYGSFIPSKKLPLITKTVSNEDAATAFSIFRMVSTVLASNSNRTIVVYEYTDWHRSLSNRNKNWRIEYATERKAQRALGKAEAALSIACVDHGIEPIGIGANEAKKEFGAIRKDAAARIFASEYPRFTFRDDDKAYLYDELLEQEVSHHISDAFVIASVIAKRIINGHQLG